MDDLMEYESTPMMYIVELERTHVSALLSAAQTVVIMPGITEAEADLMNDAFVALQKQTVNL